MCRIAERLLAHKAALEEHLFCRVKSLFGLQETITLYDVTNTYFEGRCRGNTLAAHGHSNRSLRVNPANLPQSLAQHGVMHAKDVRPHCCRFDIRRRVGLRLGSYQVFPVDVQAFSLPSSPITLNAAAACQS
jgi:hypothetical protein